MKKAVIIILSILLIIVILTVITLIIFFAFTDTKTTVPEEVKEICNVEQYEYMKRNVFVISPSIPTENVTNKNTILYFHGGAYMAEASKEHWNFVSKLVNDTGSTLVLVDYPLTPKYTYKDVFDMIEPLYKEAVNRIGAENLILLGDSAGGGIALALEEKIGEQELPMPNKTILISPWLDVRLTNEQIDEVKKKDDRLNEEALKLAGIIYASKDGINSYLVNPIDGDLSKLKNITILAGTNDILTPDIEKLKQKAEDLNVSIEIFSFFKFSCKEFEGADHIWIINETTSQELIDEGYNEVVNLIDNNSNL